MPIIIDRRSPKEAIAALEKYGDVHLFESTNVTYEAVSCHPDIFIFENDDGLIIAPDTPSSTIEFLSRHDVMYEFGETMAGDGAAGSVAYNCIATDRFFFHRAGFSDPVVLRACDHLEAIMLPQAYTRCSMIALNDHVVTSDMGIYRSLEKPPVRCHYVSPGNIVLPPYPHGFIGGCCGLFDGKLFVIGSLRHLADCDHLYSFIEQAGFRVVELYDGPPYDGGGIMFLN